MKAEFLKIAGVKSEAEFYKKFPSEEAFMKKHGKAVKSLMAKKAQVGAMIPNKVAPMQNPLPVRVTQDTLYDEAALRTGRKTIAEMKDEAMYNAKMAKLAEKPKPSFLEQLMNPLGGGGDTGFDMSNLFGGDDSAPSTGGGEKTGSLSFPEGLIMEGVVNRNGGKVKKAGTGMGVNYSSNPIEYLENTNTASSTSSDDDGNPLDDILNSKAVKIGAPIVSDIYQISQQMKAQKDALASARQATAVANIAAQAARTTPEQIEREYVRPEDVQNTGEEFFPIYGVGTNVLSRNGGVYKAQQGGMFSDSLYTPLVNPNQQKAFGQGGILGSNSYLVPKAAVGVDMSNISYGGGTGGNLGMQAGQAMGFTDAGSQIGGKIGGTIGSAFGPVGSAVGSFIGSGIGDLLDRDDRRTAIEQKKANRANQEIAYGAIAPAIQAGYASHVRNGGKIPSNPSMLDTMAMGGDVKTLWGGKVETASYNPYAGGESIEFKGNSHDYRDPRTGETGIGVAYGEQSVASNTPVVEVENEPAQKLGSGGESENLVVYGDLKIPEEYVAEIGDDRAKGKKFKNYVSDILNKDEAKTNKKMEKAAEMGLEADNTKWGKLQISTANAIVDGGDMKLKSIADKKMILADLQSALNDTFDEYGVKGNEFIAKNKIVEDPERVMNNMAKSGIEINPENKGKFTAWAKERGMSVTEAANMVMANTDEYSPGVVKMANFAKNARKFNKAQDGDKLQTNQLGKGKKKLSVEEAEEQGYTFNDETQKWERQVGDTIEAVDPTADALAEIRKGQSKGSEGYYGKVTVKEFEASKEANPWFDWENFDPSSEADVMRFQKEFNKRAKEAGSDSRIKEDGKFGEQTASARFTPGAPGQEPKVEVAEVEETTTETTTATPQGLTPIGGLRGAGMFDVPLDANDFLAEQYAMATGQVQPVYAQTYQPQLRVPYDISLQDTKNDIVAQMRALEDNPAYQNNPSALAIAQGRMYEALNKINAEEFRMNQAMKDTVYSGNIDTLNKARLMNLGVYDQQQDRLAEATSKTRTQNIDILSSISDKYAKNRLENKLARVYQNLYPSYRYDKDGNLVPVGGATFNVNGQMIGTPGFMPGTGVIPTAQNILTGVGMAQALGAGNLFNRREKETPVVSAGLKPYGPTTESSELTRLAPTPQQMERMYFQSLDSPVVQPGEVTAQLMQDPTALGPNWWEQETPPQGKKGKTVKKNNKNSNILRALKNL